eukprot:475154-Pyramimonas_sp.AAC.1
MLTAGPLLHSHQFEKSSYPQQATHASSQATRPNSRPTARIIADVTQELWQQAARYRCGGQWGVCTRSHVGSDNAPENATNGFPSGS